MNCEWEMLKFGFSRTKEYRYDLTWLEFVTVDEGLEAQHNSSAQPEKLDVSRSHMLVGKGKS
jgi:hypothetical protein